VKSVLIDSDILIEVSRGRDAGILTRWDAVGRSQTVLTCSPVTVAELWHGARPQEHKILEDLFAAIQCVPIDLEIGRRAGDYLKAFAKSHSVELGDALIAATASAHGLELWTRNRRHYPMKDLVFF
jgi:predicted nucleic acid-binding protein